MNITNITIGVDPSRVQNERPSFFVSWKIDGKMSYEFFAQRWMAETFVNNLKTLATHYQNQQRIEK